MTRAIRGAIPSIVSIAALSACSTPSDPGWMLGHWRLPSGAEAVASCEGVPVRLKIDGSVIRLSETAAGAELELGCRCHLRLTGDGRLEGPTQSCRLTYVPVDPKSPSYDTVESIESWSITPGDGPDVLISAAHGTMKVFQIGTVGAGTDCTFDLESPLERTTAVRPPCGDDRTAVGVWPRNPPCHIGAGTEPVLINMSNDPQSGCASSIGARGDTTLASSGAVKSLNECEGGKGPPITQLHFCRVDGSLLRPFPADGTPGNAYAVLRLGKECPPGAVKVSKHINNADESRMNATVGDIGDNLSVNDTTVTDLELCLFLPAGNGVPNQSVFPSLGFPYALFHDFDGYQPPWVAAKQWIRSDDETTSRGNSYSFGGPGAPSPDGREIDELKRMIENLDDVNDTVFDIAILQ